MSSPIFISHAVANKELADKLVDLFETGIGIQDKNIFCSSLEGLGIPSGKNFVEFIKEKIKKPEVIVLLLTPDYFTREFCLCELGAAWALSHRIIPLLLEPLAYSDVKGVLTGVQVLNLSQKKDLNQMQNDLCEALQMKGKSFARWEIKRDEFLVWLSTYIQNSKPIVKINPKEFETLKENYADAKSEIINSEKQIKILKAQIEKLSKAKDSGEVAEILNIGSTDIEKFNKLTGVAFKKIEKLPRIVRKALYYDFQNQLMPWPGFGYNDETEEIKSEIENDFLIDEESGVSVNSEDPKVAEAIKALEKLNKFIEQKWEDIEEWYVKEHGHQLKISSRRFWEENLY